MESENNRLHFETDPSQTCYDRQNDGFPSGLGTYPSGTGPTRLLPYYIKVQAPRFGSFFVLKLCGMCLSVRLGLDDD